MRKAVRAESKRKPNLFWNVPDPPLPTDSNGWDWSNTSKKKKK